MFFFVTVLAIVCKNEFFLHSLSSKLKNCDFNIILYNIYHKYIFLNCIEKKYIYLSRSVNWILFYYYKCIDGKLFIVYVTMCLALNI